MNFQIASDLHLEFRSGVSIRRNAPLLVLAGDICPAAEPFFTHAISAVAEPFDAVMYVPGNHEYYGFGSSPAAVDAHIERLCYSQLRNVIFMNKRRVDIGGFAYIGATLWTNCPSDESKLNDFGYIDSGDFSPARMNALHREHRDWIKSAIKQSKRDGMTGAVVITHHAPDKMLAKYATDNPRSKGDISSFYYANDMADVTRDPFVQVFVHGHTHEAYRMQPKANAPIYVSNALGYPEERTGYSNGGAVLRLV